MSVITTIRQVHKTTEAAVVPGTNIVVVVLLVGVVSLTRSRTSTLRLTILLLGCIHRLSLATQRQECYKGFFVHTA